MAPLRAFVSYSHRDRQYRERLKVALAQLRRDGLVTEWDDQMISAGDEWDESIQQALASAELVLLLVSPDFIASNYSYDNELAKALARQERGDVRIIPIIVRPADWHSAPFAHLQALPTGARAVTEWSNRDRAWADIAAGIRRVAGEATAVSATVDEHDGCIGNASSAPVIERYLEVNDWPLATLAEAANAHWDITGTTRYIDVLRRAETAGELGNTEHALAEMRLALGEAEPAPD